MAGAWCRAIGPNIGSHCSRRPKWCVLASERRTGDRNRALAYLLRAGGVMRGSVEETRTWRRRDCRPRAGFRGVIVAVAPGRAGIAVASPRINAKGGSVRGHSILQELAQALGWHFASPGRGVHACPGDA
jgi:glutaminase